MAYIDVDKFAEKICDFQAIDEDAANKMIWLLRTFPTADVVPKSEVEKLNKELDNLAEELSDLIVEKDKLFDEVVRLRTVLDEYEETSGLKKAKADVAREIFEEIEEECVVKWGNSLIFNQDNFYELKKKYTEASDEKA